MQPKRIHGGANDGSDGIIDATTDQIIFVEIFAGSAKLSSAASNRGFKARYFGTQSLIPFGFNIAEPHLVARPLKEKKRSKMQNIVLLCNL